MKSIYSRASVRALAVAGMIASVTFNAHAGFFIPKDTTMVMGMISPTESMTETAYGFTRDTSAAIGVSTMTNAARSYRWQMVHAQATKLVGRLFNEDGIGNAYVFAGPLAARAIEARGFGRDFDGTRLGAHAGVWLDYETRRYYGRASWHGYKTSAFAWNESVAQAMVAPYLADYEDVATFVGVQAKRRTNEPQTEVTPYLRLFKKTWWLDAGMSVNRAHRRDVFINLMHTF